jgi:hypothetical protein
MLSCLLAQAVVLSSCGSDSKPQEFVSRSGGFAVAGPAAMEEVTIQTINRTFGIVDLHIFNFNAMHRKMQCYVTYSDYPEVVIAHFKLDAQKVLDGARDAAVGDLNHKLVIEQPITLGANPGRELVIEVKAQGGQVQTLKARLYLVKNRLYQVKALAPKGEVSVAEMDEFLRSFRLLAK